VVAVATAALAVMAVAVSAGVATAAPAAPRVSTAPVAGTAPVFGVAAVAAPVASNRAVSRPSAQIAAPLRNIDWQSDFNADLAVASTNFGLAAGLGGMIGGVVGVGLGCPLGAVTAGLTFATTGPVAVVPALAGCPAGSSLLGPVVGDALLGAPVAIVSAVRMCNTMHAAGEVAAPLPR
jgi:hypothetical protein